MSSYFNIPTEVIVSRTARQVYWVSATLSVLLFCGLFCGILGGAAIDGVQIPEAAIPVAKLLLFACVIGAATTTIGMEVFLFRFDNSHWLKQVFWFAVMLFPLLGAALYCFLVYSRSDLVRQVGAKRAESASA